jgi:hypothetical protein
VTPEVVVSMVRIVKQKNENVNRYNIYLSAITTSCFCKRSTTFLINTGADFLRLTSSH